MSTSVGKLTADLIARTKKFEEGMKRSNRSIRRTGRVAKNTQRRVRALGAAMRRMRGAAIALAGVGGMGMLIRSSIEFGSKQSDIARQLQINTEAFQTYAGAIRDAGGTQEQLVKSFSSMQQAIVQGSEGLSTYTRAFGRLGINVNALRQLNPERQFEEIAHAVARASDQQGAFTAAIEIFGKRNAPQLIEVMQRLSRDGYGRLAEEIRKTYGIMDRETQRRLDLAADRIEQFKNRMTIRVGEIITGEANFAALKESLFKVASMVTGSVATILDKVSQYGGATFSSLADFIAERVGQAFSLAIDMAVVRARRAILEMKAPFMRHKKFLEAMNKNYSSEAVIVAKAQEMNQRQLLSYGELFAKRLSEFKDRSFFNDMTSGIKGYFDALAGGQREMLENYRKNNPPAHAPKRTFNLSSLTGFKSKETTTGFDPSSAGLSAGSGLTSDFSESQSVGSALGFGERVTSAMLRGALRKIESTAQEFRRAGLFEKSRDLLNRRFGLRRQIAETRTQERIDAIRSGETSFRASDLDNPRNMSGDPTERIAKLQERNVELLEIIKNEFVGA